jgi:16S rRNA (cytosine967-C5)-methyltransferase
VQKPREIAARVLQRRAAADEFTETLLDRALAGSKMSAPDRGLCRELVFGCVRWQAALDWLIAQKTGGRDQRPGLQVLLRLGLYQIFWLDRIPEHAAVHETVELAKRNGFGGQAGFVNAVLRGYLREADATRALLAELKTTQPAIGWSHPEWLVERWQKIFGTEKTLALLEWNNTPAKIFARVNTLKTDAEKLLAKWREENVVYDFFKRDWMEENLIFELKEHPPIAWLESFKLGWFYIQDPSTVCAVRELGARPGEKILDFCAAPGGKTTLVAQDMRGEGELLALDISRERLDMVQENCTRLGASNVKTALSSQSVSDSQFDRVLVDAPCSNTGVMRRRVDLRWRVQPSEIERLCAAQLDLLQRAARAVRPGGVLVYSTCSLEPEENGEVLKGFLRTANTFELKREQEIRPFTDGTDGAYVASLTKIG